jgi:hypothetical protein
MNGSHLGLGARARSPLKNENCIVCVGVGVARFLLRLSNIHGRFC